MNVTTHVLAFDFLFISHFFNANFFLNPQHAIPRSHKAYAWLQKINKFIPIAMNAIKILNKFTPTLEAINVYVYESETRTTVAVDVSGWQK
jgi:hypothetical protein